VLASAKDMQVPVHRVSQGSGVMLLTKKEISEMAHIGADQRIEVCLFVGPRAPWETSAQAVSTAGKVIGLAHRGADQLVYAIEDVKRATDLGIRSILPADLGLIWVLNEMKKKGELPKNCSKARRFMANPATASLRTLRREHPTSRPTTPRRSVARQTVEIPIDMYIEVSTILAVYHTEMVLSACHSTCLACATLLIFPAAASRTVNMGCDSPPRCALEP
jgi:hypothetical protein